MFATHGKHLLRLSLTLLATMLLAASPSAQGKTGKASKPGKAVDIVFVGNSYTHFHDLPAFVRALGAADQPPRAVTTTMLAPGGFSLQGHWQATGEEAPLTVIQAKRPDFVVLQEQSRMPLDNPTQMHEFAEKFAAALKKAKVTPVWYMTWARKAEPESQERITEEYTRAHKAGGGLLAPVGRAWQVALGADPKLSLHSEDGSHPSPHGTYLAACVLYVTMCGGDVSTFPDRLAVKGDDDKERVLVELPQQVGKQLRAAAALAMAPTKSR